MRDGWLPKKEHAWAGALAGLFLFPLIVPAARACVMVEALVTVGSHFVVRLSGNGVPVAGVNLTLRELRSSCVDGRVIKTVMTDRGGQVEFDRVPKGDYLVCGSSPLVGDEIRTLLHVATHGKRQKTAEVENPDPTPIVVGSASGELRAPGFYPRFSESPISIALLDIKSKQVLRTATTDANGKFSLGDDVEPGKYFLKIKASSRENEGMVLIDVRPDGEAPPFDMDYSWSDCGMTFRQREIGQTVQVQRVCGGVVDPLNAAIERAAIYLIRGGTAADGRVVATVRTDREGKFEFGPLMSGDYLLVATSPGFFPQVRKLHVDGNGASPCRTPINLVAAI
jgi:5-hydroxyisourate hydrolase-like protein (transthyretin family)